MKWLIQMPSDNRLKALSLRQEALSYSYPKECWGTTLTKLNVPKGYLIDENKVCLGEGHLLFAKAKKALQDWQMFPRNRTLIFPSDTLQQPNQSLWMGFRLLGFWWLNGCRVVYALDLPRHYGFAYGTLPSHVVRGEELFEVYMDEEQKVWYRIYAFSTPNYWLARIFKPFARYNQRRFARQSMQQMKNLINPAL